MIWVKKTQERKKYSKLEETEIQEKNLILQI